MRWTSSPRLLFAIALALATLGARTAAADDAPAEPSADDAAHAEHHKAKKKAKEAEKRKTGDTIEIPASKVPGFKAGKNLKDALGAPAAKAEPAKKAKASKK